MRVATSRHGLPGMIVLLAAVTAASAHDFWVRPSRYRAEPRARIDVSLFVGDHFDGARYARNPRHVKKFVLVGPKVTRPVRGAAGADPAGRVKIGEAGTYVLGYRSTRSRIVLDAEDFEAYLLHEGLDHVVRARARRGETEKPGREVFSRCAKSILCVGEPTDEGHDRALGFDLELTPATNPYLLKPGGALPVRLTFGGKPLARALVTAHHEPGSRDTVEARTDAQGRATLTLPHPGEWMVNAVHMTRAPEGLDADWESVWASLTFELPTPR